MTPSVLWKDIKKMHWTHWFTLGLMVTSIAIWIAWDIYVATDSIPGNTESELVRSAAKNSLLLTAALGVLISHWLWPNKLWYINGWISLAGLSVVGLLWLGFDIHYWVNGGNPNFQDGLSILRKYPILNFQIHTLIGYAIWSTRF